LRAPVAFFTRQLMRHAFPLRIRRTHV
jgi:hypothetical protein